MAGVTDTAETSAQSAGLEGSVSGAEASCPKTALEIGVFFDGTWNNAANAATGGDSGSYANAQTNVYLLAELYKDGRDFDVVNENGTGVCRKFRSRYVRGIGTVSGDSDSRVGGGVGMGSTGVEATVARACLDLGRDINELSPGIEPEEILLDVFGFSRGAAAARYFVNAFRQGWIDYNPIFGERVRGYLPEDRNIKIRFVGIFDTVASIGLGNVEYNHGVNIHLSTAQADAIFHITAANEYRINFRLNHNLQGGGEAFEMSGAHADIGGGYRDAGDRAFIAATRTYNFPYRVDAEDYRDVLSELPAATPQEMAPWVAEGWVRADEAAAAFQSDLSGITQRMIPGAFGMPQTFYEFSRTRVLDRPWVQIGLSRVAMAAMYDRSQEMSPKVPFTTLPTSGEYRIPGGLTGPAAKIRARTQPTDAEKLLMVHDFAHVSANPDSFGFGGEGDRVRHIYWNRSGSAK